MILRRGIYAQRNVGTGHTTLIPGDGTTTWDSLSGTTGSLGKILPSSTAIGWGKVGRFGTVPSATDFEYTFGLEYMAGQSSNGFMMVGVTDSVSGTGYANMKYNFYLNSGSQWQIWENGSGIGGAIGTWIVTDTFKIKRVGTTVTYYKNGALIYTSLVSSSTDIEASFDINRYLGAKDNQIIY